MPRFASYWLRPRGRYISYQDSDVFFFFCCCHFEPREPAICKHFKLVSRSLKFFSEPEFSRLGPRLGPRLARCSTFFRLSFCFLRVVRFKFNQFLVEYKFLTQYVDFYNFQYQFTRMNSRILDQTALSCPDSNLPRFW